MFREITYITCILSTSTFGTELIFRFKPENKTTNIDYNLQSDVVIGAAAFAMIASLVLLKIIDSMTRFRIRAITVWTVALLIAAIVLRARYGIFMPLNDTRYNLYNSTSFFLCLTVITWSTFWFFKKVSPLQNTTQHELSYSLPQRRPSRENNALSVHRYDEEIDYTLPSYSELPSPPAYTKLPDVVVIEHTQDHDQTMNTFSHSNPTHERHSIDIVDMNQPNHQQ